MFNIFSDIAGQYKTLQALLEKMPEGIPISVGDMVDRGPQSYEVVDFFMKNGKAVMGNHEHMMLDFIENRRMYARGVWEFNGGLETYRSYTEHHSYQYNGNQFDPNHINWLKSLPVCIEHDDDHGKIVITHAPINPVYGLERALDTNHLASDFSVIWNRGSPKPIDGVKLQVYGHNSHVGLQWFGNPPFAVCLDTSRKGILTALNWPSGKIYQQEYI